MLVVADGEVLGKDATTLSDKVSEVVGTVVVDDGLGAVVKTKALNFYDGFDVGFVGGYSLVEAVKNTLEGNEFARFGTVGKLEVDFVVEVPLEMGGVIEETLMIVSGDNAATSHGDVVSFQRWE